MFCCFLNLPFTFFFVAIWCYCYCSFAKALTLIFVCVCECMRLHVQSYRVWKFPFISGTCIKQILLRTNFSVNMLLFMSVVECKSASAYRPSRLYQKCTLCLHVGVKRDRCGKKGKCRNIICSSHYNAIYLKWGWRCSAWNPSSGGCNGLSATPHTHIHIHYGKWMGILTHRTVYWINLTLAFNFFYPSR